MENKENKTAVQQVFSELEKMQPGLFNIYSEDGRNFINHFHKFLEIEKQQLKDSFQEGYKNGFIDNGVSILTYYNETFKK